MNRCLRITVLSSWPISCLVKCPKLFCVNSKSQASIIKPQRQIRIGCCSVRHKLTHVAQPQTSISAGPLLSVREFHTSQPQFAGPLAVLLLKLAGPFSTRIMLTALVGGRSFRKRLRKLSQHQRLHWSRRLVVLLGGFGGICVGFYFFHLEETPVTNRVRFMPISHKQVQELTEREHTHLLEALTPHILPAHHPDHQRVFVVAERLVMANQSKEMENLSWQVNVVDTDEMNAFVLPNGQIFIFSGMLKVLHNADSLAVVLGHEMSHAVLQHAAEKVSLHGFINMLLVISCALVWAVLPSDLLAFGADFLQSMILSFLLHLPYSRKLEEEADEIGMNMAAKACFDVREGPKLWRQLAVSKNNDDEPQLPAWLSTHPTHNDRADKLEGLLPKALKIRENCKCPPLSPGKLFQRTGPL